MSSFLKGLKEQGFIGTTSLDPDRLEELLSRLSAQIEVVRGLRASHRKGLAGGEAIEKLAGLLQATPEGEAHLETFLRKMHGLRPEECGKLKSRWAGHYDTNSEALMEDLGELWERTILYSSNEIVGETSVLAHILFEFLRHVDAYASILEATQDLEMLKRYEELLDHSSQGLITAWPVELFAHKPPMPGALDIDPWTRDIAKVMGRLYPNGKWRNDGPGWKWLHPMFGEEEPFLPNSQRDWEEKFARLLLDWMSEQTLPLVWGFNAEAVQNSSVWDFGAAHRVIGRFWMNQNKCRESWIPTCFDSVEKVPADSSDREARAKRFFRSCKAKVILRLWLLWMREVVK